MSLVSIAEVRTLVKAPMTDPNLQVIIDRIESYVDEQAGIAYAGPITETLLGGNCFLFTKRPIESVTSVTEYSSLTDTTGTLLVEGEDFFVMPDQGRLINTEGLGGSVSIGAIFAADDLNALADDLGVWDAYSVVVYVPQDQTAKRKEVIIDLIRLDLSRSALLSESIAGEHSYTSPSNWEQERRIIIRRLQFIQV